MRDEVEVKAALNAIAVAMLSAQECDCEACHIIQDVLAPAMTALMFARGSKPYEVLHRVILKAVRCSIARAEIKTKCEAAAAFERMTSERN